MRRAALAVVVAVVLFGGHPAAAHVCTKPVELRPGRVAQFEIGVASEESPVVAVDVQIPTGFRLEAVGNTPGWTSARDGTTVRFTGGPITPFQCGYFRLTGEPLRKATLSFPVTVHTEDGGTVEYASRDPLDPYGAQLVYAGTDPPDGGDSEEGEGGGAGPEAAVTLVLLAVAFGGAMLAVRNAGRRRARAGRRR